MKIKLTFDKSGYAREKYDHCLTKHSTVERKKWFI